MPSRGLDSFSAGSLKKNKKGDNMSKIKGVSNLKRILISFLGLIAVLISVFVADKISGKQNTAGVSESVTKTTVYETVSVTREHLTDYTFRSSKLLTSHFEKHGREVGAKDEMQYVDKANAVISNPDALYKTEAEDGDGVYFLQATGEIVFLSTDGYIRTYYIADYDYFNRQ